MTVPINFPTYAVQFDSRRHSEFQSWCDSNCEYPWASFASSNVLIEKSPVNHTTITGDRFPSSTYRHTESRYIFFTSDEDRTKFLLKFGGK